MTANTVVDVVNDDPGPQLAAADHIIQNHGPGDLHVVTKAAALADKGDALGERGIVLHPHEKTGLEIVSGGGAYLWSATDGDYTTDS